MTIDKKKEGNRLVLAVSGRLDTMTAPELESVIKDNMDGVEELILDFKDLEYISSAGLRVVGRPARGSRSQKGHGKQGILRCSQSLQ